MAGSKTYQDLPLEIADTDSELLFEMANLSPKRTGLPFVVWISPRGNARHDIRVKVSPGPRAVPSEMVSIAIRPDVYVVEGEMKASDLALLSGWTKILQQFLEPEIRRQDACFA